MRKRYFIKHIHVKNGRNGDGIKKNRDQDLWGIRRGRAAFQLGI